MIANSRTKSYPIQELIVPGGAARIELMVTIDEKQAFSARLNLVLDEEGLPPKGRGRQNKLASDWDLSQKGVRKWLEGEGIPETTRLIEMAKRYRVSFEWLATGRDPITLQPSQSVIRTLQPDSLAGQDSDASAVAKRLAAAIIKADLDGMPDVAFNALHQTLKAFDSLLGPPPDNFLDVNTRRPPEG